MRTYTIQAPRNTYKEVILPKKLNHSSTKYCQLYVSITGTPKEGEGTMVEELNASEEFSDQATEMR